MTMQPETRFRCDRCHAEVSVPLNDQPSLDRGKPPGDWLVMYLHGPTGSPQHLCPDCTKKFDGFMSECMS